MMAAYTQNALLLEKLEAYRQMRERIRKPLTSEALRLALMKLDGLAADDNGKVAVLEQSVFNSWQGLFAISEQTRASPSASRLKSFDELEEERVAKMKAEARLRDEARLKREAV